MITSENKTTFQKKGFCPICENDVLFSARRSWFRDFLVCSGCGSIPRERALIQVIKTYYPNYKSLKIHETSPCNRGASPKLKLECSLYSASQYYPELKPGKLHPEQGFRNENLESMTFPDESFDLFISQDVMEHIFDPGKAFREISRVLKFGGAHIFTVPLVNKANPSECWAARKETGEIEYLHEPEYHGNPINDKGSMVTMHWGYDIAEFIQKEAENPTTIVMIDNIEMGIRAEYIEVLVSRKI
jgi:SAM-dependent methyltransferase